MDLFKGDGREKSISSNSRAKKSRSPKQVERDALFDALGKQFFPEGVGPGDGSRIGLAMKNLKAKNARPEDVALRAKRFDELYPKAGGCTLEGLTRQWDRCCPPKPHQSTHGYDDPLECQRDRERRAREKAELGQWAQDMGKERLEGIETQMLAAIPKYKDHWLKWHSRVQSVRLWTLRLWTMNPDHEDFRKYR